MTLPAGVTGEAAQKYLAQMGYKQPRPNVTGPLFQYCKSPDSVHCPGDQRCQLPFGAGYSGPYSWDSYSGATYLNGESRANAGSLSKRTQVGHPSARFIWIEGADMRGENVGSWTMNPIGTPAANFTDGKFRDSVAAFHITSAVFNFCDGHAESHKWMDGSTVAFAKDTSPDKDSGGTTQGNANNHVNQDAVWISRNFPGKQNP